MDAQGNEKNLEKRQKFLRRLQYILILIIYPMPGVYRFDVCWLVLFLSCSFCCFSLRLQQLERQGKQVASAQFGIAVNLL